jgi:hypothetical protein
MTYEESLDFAAESDHARDKLGKLKQRIMYQANCPVRHFSSPKELGDQIIKDLFEAIKKDFPLGK